MITITEQICYVCKKIIKKGETIRITNYGRHICMKCANELSCYLCGEFLHDREDIMLKLPKRYRICCFCKCGLSSAFICGRVPVLMRIRTNLNYNYLKKEYLIDFSKK